ncbi:GFA family protein [Acuticoccus sp. MNP-M23]|uniref:GFA family protein n=1 Tax=Acuticoccus sp. MNP-M23 TaxID=3072793 RepID=UPI002815DBDF|nr:GFA family protein [Acuticoccus sp. MNP-M23]WMS42345.1 GFA family protein [Acuticoccus sp. MNP-M23]
MADAKTGRCQCGAVTFTTTLKKDDIGACHCSMCRRISAGPFIAVDAASLDFADGAPVTVYDSSEWATRSFCARCGTTLAWRSRDGAMIELNVFTLDEPPAVPLSTEIFIDQKPDTYAFAGDTHKMTGAEVMALAGGQ